MGMKTYRQQISECLKNGTLKKIKLKGYHPGELALCTKHLEQCSSEVCKQARIKGN